VEFVEFLEFVEFIGFQWKCGGDALERLENRDCQRLIEISADTVEALEIGDAIETARDSWRLVEINWRYVRDY
jgi:hypothetical protein